jgi:hypothetical protein
MPHKPAPDHDQKQNCNDVPAQRGGAYQPVIAAAKSLSARPKIHKRRANVDPS